MLSIPQAQGSIPRTTKEAGVFQFLPGGLCKWLWPLPARWLDSRRACSKYVKAEPVASQGPFSGVTQHGFPHVLMAKRRLSQPGPRGGRLPSLPREKGDQNLCSRLRHMRYYSEQYVPVIRRATGPVQRQAATDLSCGLRATAMAALRTGRARPGSNC